MSDCEPAKKKIRGTEEGLSTFGPLSAQNKMSMLGGGAPMGSNMPAGMSEQEQRQIRMIQSAMESCPVKTAMAGAAGWFFAKTTTKNQ